MDILKPEGLTPEQGKFWDEHAQTLRAIIGLYIDCAKNGDSTGLSLLNFFISICSQLSAHYINDALEPTQ